MATDPAPGARRAQASKPYMSKLCALNVVRRPFIRWMSIVRRRESRGAAPTREILQNVDGVQIGRPPAVQCVQSACLLLTKCHELKDSMGTLGSLR